MKNFTYGIDLEKQTAILNEVTSVRKNMRIGKRKNLLPFQKEFLLSNVSLMRLYQDVISKNAGINICRHKIYHNQPS